MPITNLRVSQVSIHAFRGISNDLSLDFRAEASNTPCSLILFGDNGSGKSSIVDAIEFALQARIARKQNPRRKDSPSALSFASNDSPTVRLLLSDGSHVERNFVFEDGRPQISSNLPHKSFTISPFVLRRADILDFTQTSETERQKIFFDYLRTPNEREWGESLSETEERLHRERIEEKNKRRTLISGLAQKLRVPADEISTNIKQLDEFLKFKIYREVSEKTGKGAAIHPEIKILVDAINESSQKIKTLNGELNKVSKLASIKPSKSTLSEVLTKIGDRLTKAFLEISTSTFVNRVELSYGDITVVSLSLNLYLHNNRVCAPNQILSEANLDLLALLMFLAVTQESAARGQAKFMVLDDVLQSIDATVRVSVIEYILREFADWQLIVTTHDRLWQNQLRELFRRHNHSFIEREIVRWEFDTGPIILDGRDIGQPLQDALKTGDAMYICSKAGLLLEAICNRLSWTLPISVTRHRGDKYTLGDLWPGVLKVLRKTNVHTSVQEVDKWLHLRNLVGAHYNEWAQSISNQEACLFGEAVLKLFSNVRCEKCFRWIEIVSERNQQWACRCGQVTIEVT